MNRLSEEQVISYKETFKVFDFKSEGLIDCRDLIDILTVMGHFPSLSELSQAVAISDKEGYLNLDEFLDLMADRLERQKKENEVIKIIQSFDMEGSGFITMIQLHVMMMNFFKDKFTDDELEDIVGKSDVDMHGRMKYDILTRALFDRL